MVHRVNLLKSRCECGGSSRAGSTKIIGSKRRSRRGGAKQSRQRKSTAELSSFANFLAGGFGGVCLVLVGHPLDLIKVKMQTGKHYKSIADVALKTLRYEGVARGAKPKYAGMIDCMRQLFATGGLGSVFKGWEATLLRDVPGSVAYFGTYELLKETFARSDGTVSNAGTLAAGSFAGMATWAMAIPADVIKSRWQTAADGVYSNLWDVFRTLVKEEGVGALYKGTAPVMLRAFPANAACFFGVDVAKSIFRSLEL